VLGVGWDDFKTVLDKYTFIGVLEESLSASKCWLGCSQKDKTELLGKQNL
jgi:hypothetical protein